MRVGESDEAAIEAERWVLSTEAGRRLLAEVLQVHEPVPSDLDRWRKAHSRELVAAAVRLAWCRRRAPAKFTLGDRMWLDPVGLEQATSEAVARHKAERFEAERVVDLCAGIGGDAIALAARGEVLAVDLDPGKCQRIAWNARVHGLGERVLPRRARAEAFAIPAGAWVHIDPDRRASRTGRARRLEDYAPGLGFLRDLTRRVPAGAIKLSPASDFAALCEGGDVEVELVSLDGECKEATVWFGAAASCRRRASRLPEKATWTDRDGDRHIGAVSAIPVAQYIYDPDPALLRAGLLDSFAASHGLSRLAVDVDYLTSDRLVRTPFLSAFEVVEVLRLDLKRLRRLVTERGLGPLEIKTRGLSLSPERLRSKLRPCATQPATLILMGGKQGAQAFLTRRIVNDSTMDSPSPGLSGR
jgi:hypothetical protein